MDDLKLQLKEGEKWGKGKCAERDPKKIEYPSWRAQIIPCKSFQPSFMIHFNHNFISIHQFLSPNQQS
jgi:hypothetical protein